MKTWRRVWELAALAIGLILGGANLRAAVPTQDTESDKPIALPAFQVTQEGIVYLQMGFRAHVIFMGLKDLTFRQVPASWRKAGIHVGDRVVAINGQPIKGMGLIKFLNAGGERMKPLREKPPRPVRTIFEIQSTTSGKTWKYDFLQTADDCIMYGTPDKP